MRSSVWQNPDGRRVAGFRGEAGAGATGIHEVAARATWSGGEADGDGLAGKCRHVAGRVHSGLDARMVSSRRILVTQAGEEPIFSARAERVKPLAFMRAARSAVNRMDAPSAR
jgi:hypothetical protein